MEVLKFPTINLEVVLFISFFIKVLKYCYSFYINFFLNKVKFLLLSINITKESFYSKCFLSLLIIHKLEIWNMYHIYLYWFTKLCRKLLNFYSCNKTWIYCALNHISLYPLIITSIQIIWFAKKSITVT